MTVPSVGTPPSTKTKAVRFDEKVQCRSTLHRRDYTEQEMRDTFVSRQVLEDIKQDIRLTMMAIREGIVPMQRGLECRTRAAAQQRIMMKNEARTTVLQEQAEQREYGEYDPEYIAEIYSEICRITQRQAASRGRLDEGVAKIIYAAEPDFLSKLAPSGAPVSAPSPSQLPSSAILPSVKAAAALNPLTETSVAPSAKESVSAETEEQSEPSSSHSEAPSSPRSVVNTRSFSAKYMKLSSKAMSPIGKPFRSLVKAPIRLFVNKVA